MSNYSKHQQKIIKNYYDNRETISLQKDHNFTSSNQFKCGGEMKIAWLWLHSHFEHDPKMQMAFHYHMRAMCIQLTCMDHLQ